MYQFSWLHIYCGYWCSIFGGLGLQCRNLRVYRQAQEVCLGFKAPTSVGPRVRGLCVCGFACFTYISGDVIAGGVGVSVLLVPHIGAIGAAFWGVWGFNVEISGFIGRRRKCAWV